MKPWRNKSLVAKTPLVTTFLLEYANVGQLFRMWSEHSALGQNLFSWISVGLALILWCNFYRVFNPEQRFALRCTQFGVFMNALVVLTVLYFRYIVGT